MALEHAAASSTLLALFAVVELRCNGTTLDHAKLSTLCRVLEEAEVRLTVEVQNSQVALRRLDFSYCCASSQ